MVTLKDFIFDLIIIGFTIESGGVSFSAKSISGSWYRIQPAEKGVLCGWEIGQVADKWEKEMREVEPIDSFHQKYFNAFNEV